MREHSLCTTPIGVDVYACCLLRWWHSLRSFTTGYRDNTPSGYHALHTDAKPVWLPIRGISPHILMLNRYGSPFGVSLPTLKINGILEALGYVNIGSCG